jgi:hypothetical protein
VIIDVGTEEDARLIAAAPELLALVKGILDTRERHSINNHLAATRDWDERAAVILKATGEA